MHQLYLIIALATTRIVQRVRHVVSTDAIKSNALHSYHLQIDVGARSIAKTKSSKEKRTRGPNYHALEDSALCKAWCAAANDSLRGVNQSAEEFWDQVKEKFDDEKDIKARVGVVFVDRNAESFQIRFKTVSHAVSKFIKSVCRVEETAASGASLSDILMNACTLYQLSHKSGKAFEFNGPYKILSKYPKFSVDVNEENVVDKSGNKRSRVGSEIGYDDENDNSTENGSGKKKVRPSGTKAGKNAIQTQRVAERKAASGGNMAQGMVARNDIMQAELIGRVFSAAPANEDDAEYLRIQRKLIPDVMRKKEKKHDAERAQLSATKRLHAPKVSIANLCSSEDDAAVDATNIATSGTATTYNSVAFATNQVDIVNEANV